jgi:dihydroorotase-like cyclic amidohydrolase
MDTLLIKNVRLAPRWPGGDAVDVLCRHGLITQVGPGINAPDIEIVEGNGEILIPAFSDVHAHLDSTVSVSPFAPTPPIGTWRA